MGLDSVRGEGAESKRVFLFLPGMSRFFEELEKEAVEKKVRKTIRRAAKEEESEEEKEAVSNKDKKYEEIKALCEEVGLTKKGKEIEGLFKKLSKYHALFAKNGLPPFLREYFERAEEEGGLFRQKIRKFSEKYANDEVVVDVAEDKKKARSLIAEINGSLLLEPLAKRKEKLLDLEAEATLPEERHRANVYILSVLIEEEMTREKYAEICSRLLQNSELLPAVEEEERAIFVLRVDTYMRRLVKYISTLERSGEDWGEEAALLERVSQSLLPYSKIPLERELEVSFFLKQEGRETEFPLFNGILEIRKGNLEKALLIQQRLEGEKGENTCYIKFKEELGHLAFAKGDYSRSIELLDDVYTNSHQNIWQSEKTEVILHVLCICYEDVMKTKSFFNHYLRVLLTVEKNPLLLKSESFRDEVARAFVFLKYGDVGRASGVIKGILPEFGGCSLLS